MAANVRSYYHYDPPTGIVYMSYLIYQDDKEYNNA